MPINSANIAGPRIKAPEICAKTKPSTGSKSITLICWASWKPLTLADIITVKPMLHKASVGATPKIIISQTIFGSNSMPLNMPNVITSTTIV